MALSIYNLIESVCNPAGRFKTLREIGVKTDEKGDPVFSYSGTTISFSVVWKGRSYLLKCSLREEQENTLSWRRIAAYLQGIRSSFLVGYYYLSGEMLVFNDRGAAGYIDVVLMEYPRSSRGAVNRSLGLLYIRISPLYFSFQRAFQLVTGSSTMAVL